MGIARLMIHVQQVEDDQLRDKEEFKNKRANTGNKSGQQKSIANRYGSSIDPVVALSYVREIKDTFVDQVEKYDMFLDVMKDLKAQRIDHVCVIERVRELFKEYPSLLLGFNAYLPNGCEIMLNDEDKASSKKKTNNEEERNLVKNIKKCFGNDHEYKSFVDIMMMYKKDRKDINEVYHEVAVLFNDHPDMLDEFIEFLKDSITPNPL
ncbi:paired amphipathic helix protein Sin3-like 2 [Solanum tuberosum]|uniref:paired amphipathic helix protein Sin3-like 2 n=1 Tax=Solanum tuberosum TaxID=4113 RepID=UPI00073A23D2|nr:PREDICTED: paired amphipathic helix protein Sin3-like 2 [Solanum tuberosum]